MDCSVSTLFVYFCQCVGWPRSLPITVIPNEQILVPFDWSAFYGASSQGQRHLIKRILKTVDKEFAVQKLQHEACTFDALCRSIGQSRPAPQFAPFAGTVPDGENQCYLLVFDHLTACQQGNTLCEYLTLRRELKELTPYWRQGLAVQMLSAVEMLHRGGQAHCHLHLDCFLVHFRRNDNPHELPTLRLAELGYCKNIGDKPLLATNALLDDVRRLGNICAEHLASPSTCSSFDEVVASMRVPIRSKLPTAAEALQRMLSIRLVELEYGGSIPAETDTKAYLEEARRLVGLIDSHVQMRDLFVKRAVSSSVLSCSMPRNVVLSLRQNCAGCSLPGILCSAYTRPLALWSLFGCLVGSGFELTFGILDSWYAFSASSCSVLECSARRATLPLHETLHQVRVVLTTPAQSLSTDKDGSATLPSKDPSQLFSLMPAVESKAGPGVVVLSNPNPEVYRA